MKDPQEITKVGVGLILLKGNKILLGKRKGSHAHGEYGSTGGHVEHLETAEETALRELAEEAGPDIKVKNMRFLCITNITLYKPKHYIDIGFVAEWESGEPKLMEPDKRVNWDWYDINNLPEPIFEPVRLYLEAYKSGQVYFNL